MTAIDVSWRRVSDTKFEVHINGAHVGNLRRNENGVWVPGKRLKKWLDGREHAWHNLRDAENYIHTHAAGKAD